jgi:hypothetical protein
MNSTMFDKGQNSELIDLQGKINWARLYQPNKFDKWSIQFYPDAPSLEKLRELQGEGMKNVLKKDDNGWNVQLSRPTAVELRRGQKTSVTPPKVIDAERKPLEGVAIGNGTDATVTVERYTHPVPNTDKRSVAVRLYGVRVDNLVPFNADADYNDPAQAENAERMKDVPQPVW